MRDIGYQVDTLRRSGLDYEEAGRRLGLTELEARRARKAWRKSRGQDAETVEEYLARGGKVERIPAAGSEELTAACDERRRRSACPTQNPRWTSWKNEPAECGWNL